jgi:glycosyltransferase involved in cell wall biosynthesis
VFAGGADDAELRHWRTVAADAGVGDNVIFGDHVPEAEWQRLLREADVAVQLRTISNGEASAAAADCLSAGLPLVVSDQGWFAELPDEAVAKVPTDVSAALLASEIEVLLDNPERSRALADAGREHARANSFRVVAGRYLDILALA